MSGQVPAVITALAPTIHTYGYWAVGGLILIEDFGIPVPGETTLVAAAFFAGAGQLNIFSVVGIAFLAAVIGDNIGYLIGRKGGHPLVLRFGKYVFLTHERLMKAEKFFKRHGGKVVMVARFIDGLRQVNGIMAGITEMPWRWFLICNSIGAALWVSTWGLVGYFGGNHIETIYRYGTWAALGLLGIGICYLIYRFVRSRKTPHSA